MSAMGTSPVDRPIPRMWAQVINAPFEEGDSQLGLQTMRDYFTSGYIPENIHMHILILIALGRAPRQTDAATLASQSVMILYDLLDSTHQATSLAASIPTCVRGSAEAVIDYDPQHYPLMNAARRMMSNANRGFWDIVLETRAARRRRRQSLQEEAERDPNAETWTPLRQTRKRGRKMHDTLRQADAMDQGKDSHNEDDDTEMVSDRAWLVIDWMTKVWEKEVEERRRTGNPRAHSALFLTQIPPTSSYDPQWDISRIAVVISSAFEDADSYLDPAWSANEMSKLAKMALAGRLIILALNATTTFPRPLLSPTSLIDQLTILCSRIPPHQIDLFFTVIPKEPNVLFDNVVLAFAREVVGSRDKNHASRQELKRSETRVVNPAGHSTIAGSKQSYPEVSHEQVASCIVACRATLVERGDLRTTLTAVTSQLEGIAARTRQS